MEGNLYLIPLLPLLGFLVNGIAGGRLPRWVVSTIACGAPAASAVVGFLAFRAVAQEGAAPLICELWDWMRLAGVDIPFTLGMDRLSGVMVLVVTGVGTLIHVYATGYMREDPGYARFFAYMNLFMAAMLILVLADNIVLLFLGWEGVGLCSYLLIGFWYKDLGNCAAAIKAFVVNRIGDFGFLLGIFLIHGAFGTFQFGQINALVGEKEGSTLFWIGLLLFFGATGKSAQIPLYVWLPDAMAGPTPVSALIHAATMVTSGLYMVARLGPLFAAAPGLLPLIATVGTLTAFVAALIAVSQNDIKKVLAYSTVSQLGYMFLGAGTGQHALAIFHLVTHAFFKALLFLGAGAVIHALHHEQDMRRMGGLWKRIPQVGVVFLIGAAALSGFPLTSGFFSKDEILHGAFLHAWGDGGVHAGWLILWAIGLVTAAITGFYAFRQFALVFLGTPRASEGGHHGHGDAGSIHEPPRVMVWPLIVLAALALCGGFLDVPSFLAPVAPEHGGAVASEAHGEGGKLLGWVLGGSAGLVGIAAALFLFASAPATREKLLRDHRLARAFVAVSSRKFYVDELYDLLVVKPLFALALVLYYVVDRLLIDGLLVSGSGYAVRGAGSVLRRLQSGHIPAYAMLFLLGTVVLLTLALWAAG